MREVTRIQLEKLEQLRNLPAKEVVCVGSTYLDSMKIKKDSLKELPENEKPVILLAPSWGKNGILSKFGSKFIDALIKTGYQIVLASKYQIRAWRDDGDYDEFFKD